MRIVLTSLVCGLLIGNAGCMRAASRTFSEIKGASADSMPVPGTSSGRLASFKGVSIGGVRTDLGKLVDDRFRSALPAALREALTRGDEPVFSGGSPTLTIESEVMFYSRTGGFGTILGKDSYAVVLFWLTADGSPVGRIQVIAKSAAARTGHDDLAKAAAKGLAKHFRKVRNTPT